MTDGLDTEAASAALVALGQLIVEDPAYRNHDWVSLSVVGNLDGGESMFGYVYKLDGDWEGEIPDNFDVLDRFQDLRAAMSKPGEPGWNYCLIQVRREGMKLHAEFDYGDGAKWKVAPANLQMRVEDLRPS
jgi:hypothetical protein